ncbi:MAG TPA: Crp/Fnr family transcriptional regulator [Burkholderiaceae bacterium]|nr:Crp/Fnr family transcriptional regulator [Burkholderiaceae bacterium]
MPRRAIAPHAFLSALPLFKSIDPSTLQRLAAATTRRSLARGEHLFTKGDIPTGMYVVVHGEIRLIARAGRGERLPGVVGAGRSFGEPVMFLERPALVDAEAATDALLLHIPKEAVFAEIERSPRFARRVIASLSQRIEALVHELERQALGSGRARLIGYLVQRARAAAGPAEFTLPATKSAIAAQLNLTPEHFSRLLHELAASGLLQVRARRIIVPDVQRLAARAAPSARGGSTRVRAPHGGAGDACLTHVNARSRRSG